MRHTIGIRAGGTYTQTRTQEPYTQEPEGLRNVAKNLRESRAPEAQPDYRVNFGEILLRDSRNKNAPRLSREKRPDLVTVFGCTQSWQKRANNIDRAETTCKHREV